MKAFQCVHLPAALAVAISLISCFATIGVEGWSSPAKKIKDISRKSFIVGAVGGLVLGTTATAAGAAVAIERNTASNKIPYEPPAGSLNDKVVLITGGSTGLGLVSEIQRIRWPWLCDFFVLCLEPNKSSLLIQ